MANPIVSLLGSIFKPVSELVDSLHTSGEEKLAAKAALMEIERKAVENVLDYEKTLATEQGQTVRAEATGHSWMQRNWRPLIMLMFGYIIFHNYVLAPVFSAPKADVPQDMWELIKIGLGGYVIGRSAEKIVPAAVTAFKSSEK